MGNLNNNPAARNNHTAQPDVEPALNRFALKPLALSGEGGHQTERNQMRECESAGQTAWATVLPLDMFLERHRRHLGPPVSSPRPYCRSCRRLEIREKWLEKQACSVCGETLNELPSAYQP